MKNVISIIGSLTFIIFFFSCSKSGFAEIQKSAIGRWEIDGDVIEITKDTITISDENIIKYSFDDTFIYMDADGDSINCKYTLLDKNSFTITLEGDVYIIKRLNNRFSIYNPGYDETLEFNKMQKTPQKTSSMTKLNGVYKSDGNSLLESIEFEDDGTCYTVDSLMGYRVAMQYQVKGDKIIIKAGNDEQPCFRIINSDSIEGITVGFFGNYKKGQNRSEQDNTVISAPASEPILVPLKEEHITAATVVELEFPKNYIGTWKRNNYDNTLSISKNSIVISSRIHTWELLGVSGDLFTLKRQGWEQFSIPIKLINNTLEISGDTGTGQENWNGVWLKQ